ncbi:MAG: hypothetical protein COU08_00890 [Candidatus Harrisonbacteria bacterium CG10_big_fil_rev_8_21_14_0_10_42_17]|uniref:Uncharacterized protein n=1 Tax=Candidatus Harrisonbacteria bacterium CG10_big_fil_rev_8_21_14_0_10_42_17 TaxID=1974584 RepID=A0A2M6WIZ5_9BACT|nr:MAG: hypothetical protein COU08_00890 [Candidatus Harrisonbacteria bacterium CG10_big_fil_rev_8_21_14_0_10_42_17]
MEPTQQAPGGTPPFTPQQPKTPPPPSGAAFAPPQSAPSGSPPPSPLGPPPGAGESEQSRVPGPRPDQEVKLRTLSTDATSIAQGSADPIPESVVVPSDEQEPNLKPGSTSSSILSNQFGGTPPPGNPPSSPEAEPSTPKKSKKILTILISVVVVLGLVGVGYFFIFPLFFGEDEVAIAPPPPPTPTPSPTPTPPPTPVALHQSLFLTTPIERAEVRLITADFQTITQSLNQLAVSDFTEGTLQEISLLDADGGQLSWPDYMSQLLPDFTPGEVAQYFDTDFTGWIYYDEKGKWPGYAVRILGDESSIRTAMVKLESSTLSGVFLTPDVLGEFKDGSINAHSTRFATAPNGAAFNYGVASGLFFISTSYAGLQEAAFLLGL